MQLNQQLRLLLPLLLSAILLAACATAPGAGAPTSTRAPASTPTPAPTPSPTPTPIPTPAPLPQAPPGWKWFTVRTTIPPVTWHIAAPLGTHAFGVDEGYNPSAIGVWLPGKHEESIMISRNTTLCWSSAPPPDETLTIAGSPAKVSRGFVRYTQKGFLCAAFSVGGDTWYILYRSIEPWEWDQAYTILQLLWAEPL